MKKVELYTWAYCPFCIRAKEILDSKNIPYTEDNIEYNEEKKKELYKRTNQNTVPFVFINDEFIGGFTELQKLDDAGELD